MPDERCSSLRSDPQAEREGGRYGAAAAVVSGHDGRAVHIQIMKEFVKMIREYKEKDTSYTRTLKL